MINLSALVDEALSHDYLSRCLQQKELEDKEFWREVKRLARQIEDGAFTAQPYLYFNAGFLLVGKTKDERKAKPLCSKGKAISKCTEAIFSAVNS